MITPKSWISSVAVPAGLCGLLLSVPSPASAGIFGLFKKKKTPEAPVVQEPVEIPPPDPVDPPFLSPLPLHPGEVPSGLAHLGAEACNACHYGAHDGWSVSAHAQSARSPAFRAAVQDVGTPACTVCHLPLRDQHTQSWTFDGGDLNRPITAPHPHFDASLASEGVGCAACHVRDGRVLTSRPLQPNAVQAHPMGYSPILGQSELCASCHQLTWPGADQPFYDTFGEWTRSPHAEAGISCQDCHMGAGAGTRIGADHRFEATRGRGASLRLALPSDRLIRGEEGVSGELVVQNTGAGHHYPTGSPFRGVRVEAILEGPEEAEVTVLRADLARTLEGEAPWRTTEDTRLAPGEARRYPLDLRLDHDLPAGDWVLRIALRPVVRGAVQEPALTQQILPLRVE